jgi:DNA (cytosine-5)-methyltransferase 1
VSLRIGSLCAGIGLLDLAVMDALGGEVAWHAQHDPDDPKQYAAKILAHRFPGVPNLGDITAIDYADVEPVDVLTAGWPCQDMSLAGLGAGLMPGTRSGLWYHVARAIAALRPPIVILENVRSLTSARAHSDVELCPWCMGDLDDRPVLRALGAVLGDLADLGFDAEWLCLPASDIGAPHQRWRAFVLAWPSDAPRPGLEDRRQGWPGGGDASDADGSGRWRGPGFVGGPWAQEHLAGDRPAVVALGAGAPTNADSLGRERCGQPRGRRIGSPHDDQRADVDWGPYTAAVRRWERLTDVAAPAPTAPGKNGPRLSPALPEWMMGAPAGWVTDVPDIPRSAQLKALGNGVVRQQGAAAVRILMRRLAAP